MLHQMLHGVAEPFNKDFNKDSNVDFGIVIVNALFLQVSFRKMKVLTSHGCDGSSYHWDES